MADFSHNSLFYFLPKLMKTSEFWPKKFRWWGSPTSFAELGKSFDFVYYSPGNDF